MRHIGRVKIVLQIFLILAVVLAASSAFAAKRRTFTAYFGLETTPANRSVTNYTTNVPGSSSVGGTITVSTGGNMSFGNAVDGTSSDNSGNSSNTVTINPSSGYQIKSIYWIDSTSTPVSTNLSSGWSSNLAPTTKTNTVVLGQSGTPPSGTSYVTTGPGNTTNVNSRTYYIIWVVFEPIPVATYTVTGTRYPADYAGCQGFVPSQTCAGIANGKCDCDPTSDSFICSSAGFLGTAPNPATTSISQSVLATATPTYYIANSNSDCEVHMESEDKGVSWTTADLLPAGGPYTTVTPGPFTGNYEFLIGFSKKHFTITSTVDPAGAPNCGSLGPATNSYTIGSNQTFAILPNSNCAIASVLVTDTQANGGAGFTAQDVTASMRITGNSYTFTNLHAAGSITVKFAVVSTTQGAQYCQVPPFIPSQTALKPNVLMIFDNSGSMAEYPYTSNSAVKPYTCDVNGKTTTAPTGVACTLANINTFYGYFDNTKMYSYDAGTNIFTINAATLNYKKPAPPITACSQLTTGTILSGNTLNYLCMRKFDIVKKILVGGQVDPAKGADRFAADGTHYYYLKTNDGNWVQSTLTEPTGLVQQTIDKVRFGLMTYNNNSRIVGSGDGGVLITPVGADLATLVSNIESVSQNGSTPLAESFYEAIRYFQALPSAYNGASVDYGTMDPIQYSCQKNFVIQLTDGEPTNDGNVPTSTASGHITDTNIDTWWAGLSAANKPPSTFTGNTDFPYLPRLTYYAHTNDLRTSTVGKSDVTAIQNLTYYAVYAFGNGNGTATLQAAAKYGGFVDTNNNNVPDAGEYPNNNNYFEADDGTVLASNLSNVFSTIIASTASGTAAAVANNKSGQRGANMIQALFYPQWPNDSSIRWMGEVQAMWFYLSPNMANTTIFQDSDGNKELNPLIDKAASGNPFNAKALWRAGAKLQAADPTTRKIYTLLNSGSALTAAANAFSSANVTALKATGMMNVAGLTDTAASTLINYLRGTDNVVYRPRVVSFTDPLTGTVTSGVWKLGDVIDSTPQIQSSIAINNYNVAYNDTTYSKFVSGTDYKSRNMVYTGSNDGMLHAFRLGSVTSITDQSNPARIAKITGQVSGGSDLGTEEWAYIPKNALPYLQNQAGTAYCHQDLVDGAPTIADASVFKADCTATNYWDCPRKTTLNSDGSVDTTHTTWGTVLIGSMGLGGASRDIAGNCNETMVHTGVAAQNVDCVYTPVVNNGLSSYFALDVSAPLAPKQMWEFSDYSIALAADKGLGFTTPGAAVVRINSHNTTGGKPIRTTNGRWFAVFASGPTGAITTAQFTGRSDQNLKIYIVDLNGGPTFTKCTSAGQTGCNYWVKDTGIPFAFANSINGASIDLDRWNTQQDGNYSDDMLYITYTKATLDSNGFPINSRTSAGGTDTPTPWEKGGVMRLVTNHNPDPFTWFTSSLIDNTGPITSAVGILQDRNHPSVWNGSQSGNLWVYFGEGRYYYPGDDLSPTRRLFGISDPCYNQYTKSTSSYSQYTGDSYTQYALGTTAADCPAVPMSALVDQTSSVSVSSTNTLPSGDKGWYVSMAAANTSVSSAQTGAERVVSDVSAAMNGVVYFTTFTPNTDVCVPGGNTSMWAIAYNTGGAPPSASLVGKTPVQTSGGGISLVDLNTVFKLNLNRKLDSSIVITNPDGSTTTLGSQLAGMSSRDRAKNIGSNQARRMILHSQEQ